MSKLPTVALRTETIDVAGQKLDIRSLSRAEVIGVTKLDIEDAEVFMLARACDVTPAEATAWREATDADTVDNVIKAIAKLSGLTSDEEEKAPQP